MKTHKNYYIVLIALIITIIIGICFLAVFYYNNNTTTTIIPKIIEKQVFIKSPPEIVYRHPLQKLEWTENNEVILNRNSRICLAKNIFFEARGESIIGMIAVGQVTINRLHTGRWGKNICSVVYWPGQFSWTLDKNARHSVPSQRGVLRGEHWELALVAADLVAKGIRIPVIMNALYYHNLFVTPNWAVNNYKFIARIEQHLFYYGE